MKVWVLEERERYEGGHILGVFADRRLAAAALSKIVGAEVVNVEANEYWPRGDTVFYTVTEHPVVQFEAEMLGPRYPDWRALDPDWP